MTDANLHQPHRLLVTFNEGSRILIGDISAIGERVSALNNTPKARVFIAELHKDTPLPEGVPVEIVPPIRKSPEGRRGLRERR